MSIQNYRYETLQLHAGHSPDTATNARQCRFIKRVHTFLTMQNTEPIFRTERIW